MKKLIKNLLGPKPILFFALVYTLLILIFSLINLSKIPTPTFSQSDKILHLGAYLGLTLVWYLYYFSRAVWKTVQIKSLLIICLLIIAFGIFIEVLQDKLTSYRTIDSLDVLANSLGVFLGFVIIIATKNTLKKVKSRL